MGPEPGPGKRAADGSSDGPARKRTAPARGGSANFDLCAAVGIDLFMNQAADAVIVFEWKEGSAAPTVFAANKAAWNFTQALGFRKSNSIGRTVVQLFDKLYTKKVFTAQMLEAKIKAVFETGQPVQIFDDLPLPDGSKMFFDDQYCRVRWPQKVARMVQELWQTNQGLPGLSEKNRGAPAEEQEPGALWKDATVESLRTAALEVSSELGPDADDPNSWGTYVLAICRNVTEAVKKEQEDLIAKARVAEEATKAKTMFLANISHDLRTPLAGVISSADLLKRPGLGAEEREWLLNTIVNSGGALMALCNDILDITRFEREEFKLDYEPTEVRKCIETCRAMVAQRCSEKELELNVEVGSEVPRLVLTDANRLQQIVHNLMGNAVQYTEKGHVSVQLSSLPCPGKVACDCHLVGSSTGEPPREAAGLDRTHLVLKVSDSGIGLAPDLMGDVFRPFFQGKHSRFAPKNSTWKGGGAGLGLSIVKNLTQLLTGKVSVASELGVGTTFTVTLCALEVPCPQAAEPQGASAGAASEVLLAKEPGPGSLTRHMQDLRVLLAEDNPVMQRISRKILQSMDIENITVVPDGKAALQAGQDFDLVILDWHMPVMDGLEVLREMRRRSEGNPGAPVPFVVVLTADALTDCAQPFLDLGANIFMSKPINVPRLREALEQAALARQIADSRPAHGQN